MARLSAKQRLSNEINAGSMADIAFLLLIFFLVTTTIVQDSGIKVKLPPWTEGIVPQDMRARNVFKVLVNADNELLVRGEQIQLSELKDYAKEFIANPDRKSEFAQKPSKAVISLQNDRATSYEVYMEVYNELRVAYRELWTEIALRRYGKPYSEDLPIAMKRAIRAEIPLIISEAEPFQFADSSN